MTETRTIAKSLRLLKIMEMLRDCGVRPPDLAERFGVTERTIREDLLLLQGEPFYMAIERDIIYCLRRMR